MTGRAEKEMSFAMGNIGLYNLLITGFGVAQPGRRDGIWLVRESRRWWA